MRQAFFRTLLRVGVGDMQRYGLPKPEHGVLQAHPTISDDILSRIAHGEIAPKPNIARLTERTVVFADGSEVEADIVVYCTGYRVTFPFFDADADRGAGQRPAAVPARLPPATSRACPSSGCCSRSARSCRSPPRSRSGCATTSSGRYALPDAAALRADIEAERERMFKRYVASKRHTMQVDYDDYLADLTKERRRGAERARARGHALPVRPQAVEAAA